MSIGRSPTQYMGVLAKQPPNLIFAERAPVTGADIAFRKGDIWLDSTNLTNYQFAGDPAGTWIAMGSGATGGVVTLTGNSGGAISPVGGNISILGTAAQITAVGTAGTITLSLIGPYTPATYTDHGVLVGSGATSITALTPGTNGQVLLGSTGADPVFATLTSGDGSITFTPGAGTLALSAAASSVVKSATVTLTSAQIKNLVGTPIQLVAAQGAGTSIMIYQIQSKLVFGSNVFTNPQSLDVRTAGGNLVATVVGASFIDAAASTYNITQVQADTIIAATGYEDVAINISNGATEITGNAANDNTLVVTVFYSVLTQ